MFIYHENASGDAAFTRTGDAYAVNEDLKIAAVADSPLRELLRSKLRRYPQDDHGFDAANIFCQVMVAELSRGQISVDKFRAALVKANHEIAELNKQLGKTEKTYLTYDLAETVGVAAIQTGMKLIYGGLEDCYVFVFRGNDFKDVALFDYQIVKAGKYVEHAAANKLYEKELPAELITALSTSGLWEPVWCNVLRNNINAKDEQGNLVGWGCFTGEVAAEEFFQVHEIDLQPNDHIFVLSDGMIPLLNNSEFLRWFTENAEESFAFNLEIRKKVIETLGQDNTESYKEKTFVYWKT